MARRRAKGRPEAHERRAEGGGRRWEPAAGGHAGQARAGEESRDWGAERRDAAEPMAQVVAASTAGPRETATGREADRREGEAPKLHQEEEIDKIKKEIKKKMVLCIVMYLHTSQSMDWST